MRFRRFIVETQVLSKRRIKKASEIIKNNGTVIFPTETVYGLGANALSEDAVKKIFIAKGRPADNPLIVHIADFDDIYNFVEEVPENAQRLAKAYWPGPMTLVMKKKDNIPAVVSAGLDTVGVRLPENKIARKLIRLSGYPIAAPSANLSGSPSPTTVEHVLNDMLGRVDAIIKGKDSKVGVESTVIDVTGDIPVILRPGGITAEMIKKICGDVKVAKGVDGVTNEEKPKSPGMKYKHYAPKCEIILIEKNEKQIENVKKEYEKIESENKVIICTKKNKKEYKGMNLLCIGNAKKPETIARKLFYIFRKCDDLGYKIAIMEAVEEDGIGMAIMNRARRAAKK
ncbi:MAG: threonylcarbamoyl-AMP synthase [Clostridiales bacterium]|nr:threonylcarbamoyl-AMP synthase [Clostridiales bacterium]